MSYKPIDNRRDQFRQYIESNGVIEMLSKVFIELLESKEKPEHPIDYIRTQLGATLKETNQIQFLTDEVNTLRCENDELKKQLEELRRQLDVNLSTTLSSDDDTNKTTKTIVNAEDITNDSMNTSGLTTTGTDLNKSAPAAMVTSITNVPIENKIEKPISNNTDAGGGGGGGVISAGDATEAANASTISTNDGEIQVQLISSATEDAIVAEAIPQPPPVTTDVVSEKSAPAASTPIATEVDKNPKVLESQKAIVENN